MGSANYARTPYCLPALLLWRVLPALATLAVRIGSDASFAAFPLLTLRGLPEAALDRVRDTLPRAGAQLHSLSESFWRNVE